MTKLAAEQESRARIAEALSEDALLNSESQKLQDQSVELAAQSTDCGDDAMV